MRRALVLTLLMVTLPLAGCVGGDDTTPTDPSAGEAGALLSEKVYDILPPEIVWVTTSSDGQRMHNAVYRPDTDEPVPVFINFSPYWGNTAEERGDPFAQYMIEEYVPRGYAVVLSAVRGTGHSEGCFEISSDREVQDLHDVIDHFANADWSSGKIIAGGKSYDSTPQNGLIAKNPHPALEGIFHVSGITDWYRYLYKDGVPYFSGTFFQPWYYARQTTSEYGGDEVTDAVFGAEPNPETFTDQDPESIPRLIGDLACPEAAEHVAHGTGSAATGAKTDYWIERDWNRYLADTEWNGSIFFVHGLQDWNVKPDHILPWLQLLPEDIRVKGWLHQDEDNGFGGGGHAYPMRADWNRTMLTWLDHELKGKDVAVDWGFQAEGSDGVWRASETWPPTDAEPTILQPGAFTEVSGEQPGDAPSYEATVLEAGETPRRYAGEPLLHATATATNEDPVLTAVLWDVGPDGERTWNNEGVLRAVYRSGLEQPDPVPQGEPVEYTLTFYPQDDVLAPGHTWVISLGAETDWALATPDQKQGIEWDLDSVRLELPMASLEGEVEPQPEPAPCFTCP